MKQGRDKIYCVIDANLNRAKEGLRVCEDTARFILINKRLFKKIRRLRHAITEATLSQNLDPAKVLKFRKSGDDLGRKPHRLEKNRKNVSDVFLANFQRVKEALRVLEEFSKLINLRLSDKFKKLRFRLYSLEKEIINPI
ncbi:MAG: thiamine-phosphate pyrophosphorylase [Candidatus Omnitrophota bacterium]|nr:thiamine-phosphate pyrophosphorylase [Candidatus Omnitrophota bacterium]